MTADPTLAKPGMRGWLHAGMFPITLVAGVVLVASAISPRGRLASAIFVLTACALFGISMIYHRGNWDVRRAALLRRLDHANIFLIIAGTYTPLSLLLLSPHDATLLLGGVWLGALAGVAFRVFWLNAPRWLYTPCYLLLGWAAIFFLPEFWRAGGPLVAWLIIAGGVFYSAGGLIYALKRPNPSPRWFGFHEIFHALTILGFSCHYLAVFIVVQSHP
ncbi:MAG: hemolysin III family protein [Luteimonas sp.]